MDNEQELYAWCCLQALLNKAGYLSEERKEKLRELGEGRGVDFFEYYEGEIKKNHDSFRLVVEEEGEQKREVKLNPNQAFELRNLVDIHLRGLKEEIANGERDADDIDYLDLRDVRGQLNVLVLCALVGE